MTRMRILTPIAAALLMAACAGSDRTADARAGEGASAGVESARAAAALANDMAADPSHADSILTAAGYTVDSFEQLMYEIASDSARAAAYAAVRTD
jgi:hypothetical protein